MVVSGVRIDSGLNLRRSVARELGNATRKSGDIKGRKLDNILESYIHVSTA